MIYTKDSIVFHPKPTRRRFRDLEGQVFGRLTVIGYAKPYKGRTMWFAECTCGVIKTVGAIGLVMGKQISCGCYMREQTRDRFRTHGMSRSPEYKAYQHMKERCYKANYPEYPDYGGRGITVCDRWLESFENFIADMGTKPSPDLTLERRDNNLNYTPENCYWATQAQQKMNRRITIYLTHNGIRQTLMDWCSQLGLNHHIVRGRIRTLKWSTERALTTPTSPPRVVSS